MDLQTFLQGGGVQPGSGVPIAQQGQQPQTLGSFQDAMRQWLMQRRQFQGSPQDWLAGRPDPHQYMAGGPFQGAGSIGELMAQHPGRNWHPGMMRAQQYQGGM